MEWNKYFQNLNNLSFCSENHGIETRIVEDVETFTAEEVYNLSKNLKNRKASASDSLSNAIIKVAVEVLPSYFTKLFNIIRSEGTFPTKWSNSYIGPIYK